MNWRSLETLEPRGRKWLAPAIVAALTFLTFLPVLWNGFADLDDGKNLVSNPLYRGLGWTEVSWMFTTLHNGHYRPLTWVTFGFDYLIWGMNPAGYHLTSLLIHVANAVFFYFICRRLLALALAFNDDRRLTIGAGFAALLFAIHPTRVEAVALATDRKEVLAGFFFLATIYCYLKANSNSRSRRWIIAAFGYCVLSLLSKATAITLPAVLLILDYYPLGRLKWNPRQWFALLWEKIPFIVVAVPFAAVALIARQQVGSLVSLETYTLQWRLGQSLYAVGFYLWRTFVLYEIPPFF
jgi:protein O-mannosyl-transferase